MPTEEKIRRVAELASRIEASSALFLTEYRGLSVSEIAELRRSLRDADASFSVVKNTIMHRAATAAGREEITAFLSGPSAVAFVDGDAVTAAKALTGIAKRFPALVLKGGWMDGRPLTADEAKRLADLESREVMLSMIAGLVQGEIARAASVFQAAQSRFLSLLEAYKEKVPAGEQPVAAAPVESVPTDEPVEPSEEASAPTEVAAEGAEPPTEQPETVESADDAPTDDAPTDDAPNGEE